MPAASAMVSSSAAKSSCRYFSGSGLSVAAPKWLCSTSRVAAVTGIGTSHSRPSARPRSRSLRKSSGVNVVVQSRLTSAGDVFAAELLQAVADCGRLLHRDGRAIDEDLRQLAAVTGHAVLTEIDLVEILPGRDDGEQDVHVLEVEQVVDHLAADLRQRLG